ncbi:MAG: hypothetical protein AAE987_03105 [Thermoplasmataceae archaeon]
MPEEGDYSLSTSGIATHPGSSRGLEACIPSPFGEHAAETDGQVKRSSPLNQIKGIQQPQSGN